MKMNERQPANTPGEVRRKPNKLGGFLLHFMLPVIALACGIAITVYLLETKPEAKPRKRPASATLVEIQQVQSGPQQTVVYAMGEIVPAREIDLKPLVDGEVIEMNREFVPGGFYRAGETLLQIDPTDYQLEVDQLQSEVNQVDSDLLMEMGYQRIAEKEFTLLGEQVSNEEKALILRVPQLEKLQAVQARARAGLAKAQLNLERTQVRAPFNSVVSSRNVDTGAVVGGSTVLAHMVGTDQFWLRLTLPVEQLDWVEIPATSDATGSTVRVYTQGHTKPDSYRIGHVIRLEASLEDQGRMAQLLVAIDDPMSRNPENVGKPPVLLGSYVRAEIVGKTIESGIMVDRSYLRDGNSVWLVGDNGMLDIRTVDVLFRNRDQVIINGGIHDNDRLVTSSLASPIAGIPLKVAGDDSDKQAVAGNKAQADRQQVEVARD
ncbi:efflux RND transporter periplasmic adaptor subunit [Desulfosediminicola sp.]|uniref:efflux RND transporter periplasmic adaptor subunit n=1 Tax=Desulfosediminicola sp. TaxID=2886825 RepID=UPI003AF2243B